MNDLLQWLVERWSTEDEYWQPGGNNASMKVATSILLIFMTLGTSAASARPSLSKLPPGLYGYQNSQTGEHSVYYVPNPSAPYEDPMALPEMPLPEKFIPLVEQSPQPNAQSSGNAPPPPPPLPTQSKWTFARKKFGRALQDLGNGLSSHSYTSTSDDDTPTINRSWAAPRPLLTPPPLFTPTSSSFSGPTTISQFGNTTTISTPGQLPTTATQFGNTTTINRPFQMPSTVTRFGNTWTMTDPNGGLPTTINKFGNSYTVSPPFGMPSTITPFGNSMMINTPGQMPQTFTKFGNTWMSP